jgi:hypothetical protein
MWNSYDKVRYRVQCSIIEAALVDMLHTNIILHLFCELKFVGKMKFTVVK